MPRVFRIRASHPNAGIAAKSYLNTTDNALVKSFDEAKTFLAGADSRQLASHIMVHVLQGTGGYPEKIGIKLYNTNIIIYHQPTDMEEVFEATNGGFNTPTTSTRCNQFGPRGYSFCHSKKKLIANGDKTGPGVLLPFWNCRALEHLATVRGLTGSDFVKAGLVKADELNNGGPNEAILMLLDHDDPKWIAERMKEMPIGKGKILHHLVDKHDGKPRFIYFNEPVYMTPEEAAQKNGYEEKVFRMKYVPVE